MSGVTVQSTDQGKEKKLTCIRCPIGCLLTVTYTDGAILTIDGNKCVRGTDYAEKEIFHPERIVTTTVRITGGQVALLPVKTSGNVPRDRTMDVVKAASEFTASAPVRRGDVIMKDIAGTGSDLVATRTVPLQLPAEPLHGDHR